MPLKPDLRRHEIVLSQLGIFPVHVIAKNANYSIGSVQRIAKLHGISTFISRWDDEVVSKMIELRREGKTYSQIADEIGRSEYAVTKKMRQIKDEFNRPSNKLPDSVIKTITEMAGYHRVDEIAVKVGMSVNAVRLAAHRLGISTRYYKNKWSMADIDLMKKLASQGMAYEDIGKKIGRSHYAVNNKLQELGGVTWK